MAHSRHRLVAAQMSAFGGKADMNFFGNPLSRSLLGVKRTLLIAVRMSAFDPKRTSTTFYPVRSHGSDTPREQIIFNDFGVYAPKCTRRFLLVAEASQRKS